MFSEAGYSGIGFSIGCGVNIDVAKTRLPGTLGEFFWGGAASTAFWIDPKEELAVVFMTQVHGQRRAADPAARSAHAGLFGDDGVGTPEGCFFRRCEDRSHCDTRSTCHCEVRSSCHCEARSAEAIPLEGRTMHRASLDGESFGAAHLAMTDGWVLTPSDHAVGSLTCTTSFPLF